MITVLVFCSQKVVPTDIKVELINRLADTGLTVVEATSFVSPKWVPQVSTPLGHPKKRIVLPVQRVATIVASRAVAIFFVYFFVC